ncbi:MAG: FMN-binding protein [Bacillota bacterium]
MKKRMILFLTLLLMISMSTACSAKDEKIADQAKFIDGTYQGTGQGAVGEVKLEVIIEKGEIKDIRIRKHQETEGLAETIIEKMTNAIIKEQSPEVDVVSGGTMTSNAIKEGVKNALENAYRDKAQ